MTAGIDTRDLDAMARALDGASDDIATAAATAGRRIGAVLEAEVRKGARRHTATGALARSIRTDIAGTGIGQRVTIRGGPGLHLIVGGTSPHVIRATTHALALSRGGRPYAFRRSVHHPGQAADPIIARALDSSMSSVNAETDRAGAAILDAVVADARR